jgi:hypothetical protein
VVGVQGWSVEQVFALAPKPSSLAAAQPLAVPARWTATGCDDHAVWGRCAGSGAEPYETAVDHEAVAFGCSCPSRVFPCKHALALLLLWVKGHVARADAPGSVSAWLAKRRSAEQASTPEAPGVETAQPAETTDAVPAPPPLTDPGTTRDERLARMAAGLADLDRWLADRLRTGLADPSLARYATWDGVAARLVDAQVGGLANRVRRLAGMVGSQPEWQQAVLAELGMLHLLTQAGLRWRELPPPLADSVAIAVGWQVRQADVLAGVPHTAHWQVMGRSDTREDRIEVRRVWLRDPESRRWAVLLSFAAYRQSLDASLAPGSQVHADLYRYPGALGLRAVLALRHAAPQAIEPPVGSTLSQACAEVGAALVQEPWLERYPVVVRAAPTRVGSRWMLSDGTSSLPMTAGTSLGQLLACSGARLATMCCEWTPAGLLPLTVFAADRAVDVGPRVEPSFAGEAVA